MAKQSVTALAPWFGAARMIADQVGKELKGCRWVGVPFAGGMTELLYIDAPSIVVSDLHRHVINLARCVSDPETYHTLRLRLDVAPFHPDVLAACQKRCSGPMPQLREPMVFEDQHKCVIAAFDFFVCAWMGRSGKSGTSGEFKGALPVRWNANGGDSCTRFRSAARALGEWRRVFRRCNFHVMDVFEFLEKVKDELGHAIYVDPPFPDAGDDYRHKFSKDSHRKLAGILRTYQNCRVVCRFYDHPLVREMYPAEHWTWKHLEGGRKQTNEAAPEVLLIRN